METMEKRSRKPQLKENKKLGEIQKLWFLHDLKFATTDVT